MAEEDNTPYYQKVTGKKLSDMKADPRFQQDMVNLFRSRRYGYSAEKIKEKGVDGLFTDFAEHMRYQDTNEYTAARDLFFVKDEENTSENQRNSFGRLMLAWDNSEGEDMSFGKALDYAQGVVTAPSTWGSILTAGLGTPAIKGGALTASAATRIALRTATTRLLAKESAKKSFLKGAAIGGTMEAALAGGTDIINQESRDTTIEGYEFDPVQFGMSVATAGVLGGIGGGIARTLNKSSAAKTIAMIDAGESTRAAIAAAAEEAAKNTISSGTRKDIADDTLNKIVFMIEQARASGKKDPRFKLDALPTDRVELGREISKMISGESMDTDVVVAGLTPKAIFRITAAYKDIVAAAGVDETVTLGTDSGMRITEVIAKAIDENKLDTDGIQGILRKYDIKREEFSNFLIADISESARKLQQFGAVKRAVAGPASVDEKQAVNGLEAIILNLNKLSGKKIVTKNEDELAKAAAEVKVGGGYLLEGARAVDAARIGFMTSQLGTTVANTQSSIGRLGVDILDRFFENAIKLRNPFSGALDTVKGLTFGRDEVDLLMHMSARDVPEKLNYMLDDIMRVENAIGGNTGLAKTARFVNILNSATDNIFKNTAFYSSISRQIKDKGDAALGIDFLDFVAKHHTLEALPEDMLRKGVKDALRYTFQSTYAGEKTLFAKSTRGLINFHKKVPFLMSSVIPFPRFIANQVEFIHDYTPLIGLSTGLYRAATGTQLADKALSTRISRQLTGSMMLFGAYQWRYQQGPTTQPTQYVDEESGDVKELSRIAGPMNAFLIISDALMRMRLEAEGRRDVTTPFDTKSDRIIFRDEMIQSVLGTTTLPNGSNIAQLANSIQEGELSPAIRKELANVVATFTYPLTTFKDFAGQAAPKSAIKPYMRSTEGKGFDGQEIGDEPVVDLFGILEIRAEDLTRATRFAPDFSILNSSDVEKNVLRTPFNNAPIVEIDPAIRQATAINRRAPRSDLQKMMSQLGIKEYDVYRSFGEKNATTEYAAIELLSRKREKGGKDLPFEYKEWIKSDTVKARWEKENANGKKVMLEEFIKKKISAARQYAAEKFQDVAISNPKLAAGYIKNAYAIEKLKDERGVFDAVVSEMTRGTYATADEWLSSATSIEEDVTMRRQIIDAANTVKKK
jgi:hypothetical protein